MASCFLATQRLVRKDLCDLKETCACETPASLETASYMYDMQRERERTPPSNTCSHIDLLCTSCLQDVTFQVIVHFSHRALRPAIGVPSPRPVWSVSSSRIVSLQVINRETWVRIPEKHRGMKQLVGFVWPKQPSRRVFWKRTRPLYLGAYDVNMPFRPPFGDDLSFMVAHGCVFDGPYPGFSGVQRVPLILILILLYPWAFGYFWKLSCG